MKARTDSSRKLEHIKICLEKDVDFKGKKTWFEFVELIHNAAPEIDIENVDTSTEFLGRKFSACILIEGMTGGAKESEVINKNLAEAAAKLNIPMGLGSQRAAIENPELRSSFEVARSVSDELFLIANIGGVQLAEHGVEYAEKAIEMVKANALAIHLNPLQEIVQPHGTTNFKGVLRMIERLVNEVSIPIIVKEVGCGISGALARKLEEIGVSAIDVSGAGGTNWTLIERIRALEVADVRRVRIGKIFEDWGIPTAAATLEVCSTVKIPVISSGGIRSGLDVAKALALGASMAGIARPLLYPAVSNAERVIEVLKGYIDELKVAMFLTGCKDIDSLRRADIFISGPLLEWMRQRKISHPKIKIW